MYLVYRNASDILESTLNKIWNWTADHMYRMFVASDIRRLHCVPNRMLLASLAAKTKQPNMYEFILNI